MTRQNLRSAISLLAVLAIPLTASAQEAGRTDGPEGSEYGKGGYRDPGGGNFSLELNFGGALSTSPLAGSRVPLYAGLTAAFWGDDWFLLEGHAGYNFNLDRVNALLGPRFRTAFWPVSAYLGVKAGPTITRGEGVRFALSPNVGADILLGDHVLAGLGYSWDLVIGGYDAHRIYMNIGYRF